MFNCACSTFWKSGVCAVHHQNETKTFACLSVSRIFSWVGAKDQRDLSADINQDLKISMFHVFESTVYKYIYIYISVYLFFIVNTLERMMINKPTSLPVTISTPQYPHSTLGAYPDVLSNSVILRFCEYEGGDGFFYSNLSCY